MSYLRMRASLQAKAEANCGPLSDIMESCRPKHLNTKLKKSWATPFALIILEQGARITPFVRPWSTMTIKESKPLDGGRSVMRLTESCLKGRVVEEGIGTRGGMDRWMIALFCSHIVQPVTNLETKTERPGHQKLRSTIALMRKQPRRPERGELWIEWSKDECALGEGGHY